MAIVAFLALIGFPGASLLFVNWFGSPELRWIAEIEQRKRFAAQRLGPEKIILSGGSSALFGLDAEALERELGKPVLNLGIHAGLGLSYLLQSAREAARPGDTVILQLELVQYYSDTRKGRGWLKMEEEYAWTYRPDYFLHVPPRVAFAAIYGQPREVYADSWRRWNERLSDIPEPDHPPLWRGYPFIYLNRQGDLRAPELPLTPVEAPPLKAKPEIPKAVARELQRFIRESRARHVTVYAAPPIFPQPASSLAKPYDELFQRIDRFWQEQQVPLLSEIKAGLFPPEMMVDTSYHLDGTARQLHTARIGAAYPGAKAAANEGPLFVATPHEKWFPPEIPSNRVRCVTAPGLPVAGCFSIAELRQLRSTGQEILFASDDVASLLGSDAATETVREEKVSLASLLQKYPHHLFALASFGNVATAPYAEGVDHPEIAEFLRGPGSKAAIFGTGQFRGIFQTAQDSTSANTFISHRDPAFGKCALPLDVWARGGPLTAKNVGLNIAGHVLPKKPAPGLEIAVIDPEAGLVPFAVVLHQPVQSLVHLRRLR